MERDRENSQGGLLWIVQQNEMAITRRPETVDSRGGRAGTISGTEDEKQTVLNDAKEQRSGGIKRTEHIVNY